MKKFKFIKQAILLLLLLLLFSFTLSFSPGDSFFEVWLIGSLIVLLCSYILAFFVIVKLIPYLKQKPKKSAWIGFAFLFFWCIFYMYSAVSVDQQTDSVYTTTSDSGEYRIDRIYPSNEDPRNVKTVWRIVDLRSGHPKIMAYISDPVGRDGYFMGDLWYCDANKKTCSEYCWSTEGCISIPPPWWVRFRHMVMFDWLKLRKEGNHCPVDTKPVQSDEKNLLCKSIAD
jgi:hypothetical protein